MKHIKAVIKTIKKYFDEITLLTLAVFLFIVATNTQSGWLYFTTALILGLLVFNLVTAIINLKGLTIKREFASRGRQDEPHRVTIRVRNNGSLPRMFLMIEDSFPAMAPDDKPPRMLIPYIPPRQEVRVHYSRSPYRRGVYEFGPVTVHASGYLGFFNFYRRIRLDSSQLTVFPGFLPMGRLVLNNKASYWGRGERSFTFSGRSIDFAGIQEYRPGNEIRYIHWPSTARNNRLMIKEFNEIANHSITVLIDNTPKSSIGEGRDTTLEYMIKAGATLLDRASRANYTCNLILLENNHPVYHRNLSAIAVQYQLARLKVAPTDKPLESRFEEISEHLRGSGELFILRVAPFTDMRFLQGVLSRSIGVTVLFFSPELFIGKSGNISNNGAYDYENNRQKLKAMGVTCGVHQKDQVLDIRGEGGRFRGVA